MGVRFRSTVVTWHTGSAPDRMEGGRAEPLDADNSSKKDLMV